MDKERSVGYWANEGGKRIEFVALANGDVRINFNTSDGRTYESLTLDKYAERIITPEQELIIANGVDELQTLDSLDEIKREAVEHCVNELSGKPKCTEEEPCGCHFGEVFHSDGMCACDLVKKILGDLTQKENNE